TPLRKEFGWQCTTLEASFPFTMAQQVASSSVACLASSLYSWVTWLTFCVSKATNAFISARRCSLSVLCHPSTEERPMPPGSRPRSAAMNCSSVSFKAPQSATLNLQIEVGNQSMRSPAAGAVDDADGLAVSVAALRKGSSSTGIGGTSVERM